MPYKIRLTLLGGQTTDRIEIEYGPTPRLNDRISVAYPGGVAKAQVTDVRLGKGTDGADEVDAQEM